MSHNLCVQERQNRSNENKLKGEYNKRVIKDREQGYIVDDPPKLGSR